MEIYLIRHTTPLVDKGTCYGQTDLDITESFLAETEAIQKYLPKNISTVYSSPLQRCSKLANTLFPNHIIQWQNDLKELHCGEWEMLLWDKIPKSEMQPWLEDFVNLVVPGGESYMQLHHRVVKRFESICAERNNAAIVAHGGVLRSILAHITGISLEASFSAFQLSYGAVIKIVPVAETFEYQLLHHITNTEKEQHRPSFT